MGKTSGGPGLRSGAITAVGASAIAMAIVGFSYLGWTTEATSRMVTRAAALRWTVTGAP